MAVWSRDVKANEFQIYANECLTWAAAADTQEKQLQFLDLAWTWMQAAVQQGHGNLSREQNTMLDLSIDPSKATKASIRLRADRFSFRDIGLGQMHIWLFMTVVVFVASILIFGIPAP